MIPREPWLIAKMLPVLVLMRCLQEQKLTRRRAPPLSLTSLDKLNPFSPVSLSGLSSPSSSYLSPPVTSAPDSSPPPHLVSDDYLTAWTGYSKRHTGTVKKTHRSLKDSLDSNKAIHSKSVSGESDLEDAGKLDSQLNRLLFRKSTMDAAEAKPKQQPASTISAPVTTHQTVKGDLVVPLLTAPELDAEDVAANALWRTSQIAKEPSLFGSRHLRRLSQALASIVQPSIRRDSTVDDSRSVNTLGVPQRQLVDQTISATNEGPLRRKSASQKKGYLGYDTPATITLRKASDAYFVVIGQTNPDGGLSTNASMTFPPKPQSDPKPSGALLEFRSKRYTEHRKSLWHSLPLLSNQDENVERPPQNTDIAKPSTTEAVHESLSVFRRVQVPTILAEPATTFTDVYTAPQTFASIPYSRERSSSTLTKIRRTSTVKIKTRTSVHEIIWRENGDSSGSSSQGSTSPTRKSRPSEAVDTTAPTTPKATVAPRSVPQTPKWHLENPELQTLPEENIFDWSWNGQQIVTASRSHSPIDTPNLIPLPHSAPATPPRRRSISKESRDSSVESFPPLLDRKDTNEWRRAPLIDLHDPTAGRVTRVWLPQITPQNTPVAGSSDEGPTTTDNEERRQSMDGADREEGEGEPRRRSSAHPFALARLGPRGSVGSSLGASSHKRMVLSL